MSNPSSITAKSTSNLEEAGSTRVLRRPIYKFVKYLRTLFGIVTTFALISAGIHCLFKKDPTIAIGVYLIVIFCPVFLLEVRFILRTLCGTDGICCRIFSIVLSFDKIKLGLFYLLLSIPCFLDALSPSMYSRVAGSFLIVSGILYLLKDREYKIVKTYVTRDAANGN